MDVKCENCSTEYEFDDSKVTAAGITVKCTHCGHLFRVSRPIQAADPPASPAPRSRHWVIRNRQGEVREFRDLSTLQQWIVARKVSREDEISKTGETWKKLGSIVELAGVFSAVDAASSVDGLFSKGDELKARASIERPPPFGPEEVIPTGKFRLEGPKGTPKSANTTPSSVGVDDAPTIRGTRDRRPAAGIAMPSLPEQQALTFTDATPPSYRPPAPSTAGRGFLLGVMTTFALVGVAYFVYDAVLRTDTQGTPIAEDTSERAVRRGEAAYQRDTEADFSRADAEFAETLRQLGAPPRDVSLAVRALVGRARVAIARAEYSRLAGDDPAMHLTAARRALEDAQRIGPNAPATRLVLADLHRVAGDERAARAALEGLETPLVLADERRLIEAAMLINQGNWVAAREAFKALPPSTLDLPRARFLYAVALARSGRTQDAIFEVERVLTRQRDHEAAQQLLKALRPRTPSTIAAAAVTRGLLQPASASSAAPKSAAPKSAAPKSAAPKSAAPKSAAPKSAASKKPASKPKARPRGFDGLMRTARKAQEHGRTTQARRLLLQALSVKPGNAEALSSLAWCDVDDGKFARAISYFRQALQRSGGYADARYGLAVALERSGRKADAKRTYQEYLQKHPTGRRRRIVERKVNIL
ncbi:MAG: putative Zn finger-like uncharacterized protein [Bradymonadia bacterium]|jgi:predicted Zn finger-like uncharacterized protein